MRRRALAASVVAVVALAGCGVLTSPYTNHEREGGVTAAETEAAIEAVPGVTSADFSTVPWYSPGEGGLFSAAGMDLLLEVSFDPDVHLVDPGAALTSLVEVAWATNEDFPKGYVVVVFDGGVSPNTDWEPIIESTWGPRVSSSFSWHLDDADIDTTGRSVATLIVDAVADRFGRWPASPPETVDLELADGAPAPVLVPAIDRVSLYIGAVQPLDCWRVRIHRASDATGQFDGSVAIELFRAGEPAGELELDGGSTETWKDLCGFTPDTFDPAEFSVVATPLDGGLDRFDLAPVSAEGRGPID